MKTNLENIEKRLTQKITIFRNSDFGFPQNIKATLNEVKVKDYAQYRDCIWLIFTPKGKRKQSQIILKDYQSILIFDNHLDLKDEMYTKNLGENMMQSELSFSNKYFENALNSTNETPFLKIIKD